MTDELHELGGLAGDELSEAPVPPDRSDTEAYIAYLEEQLANTQGLNEAGGVVLVDLFGIAGRRDKTTGQVVSRHMLTLKVTARARTAMGAIDSAMAAVKMAEQKYHLYVWEPKIVQPAAAPAGGVPAPAAPPPAHAASTPPPAASAPPPAAPPATPPAGTVPAAGVETEETVIIKSVAHGVTKNRIDYLNIKGGRFSVHGVPAYEEVVPAEAANFKEWPVNAEYGVDTFPNMKRAVIQLVDGKPKKVTRFSA